ncbi:MAG TPA: hypothetical protein VGD98_05305 [Ktedonobacteraceae bacterium]
MQPVNKSLESPGETISFLVYPQDVNYKCVKLLCTVQPGFVVGPHKHPKLTETFKLMTGVAVAIVIEGKAQYLKPYDQIATTVLPNTIHEWVNDTNEPLTFEIAFYPPSGQNLQDIHVISAFTSYFALINESHQSSHLVHKLITAIKSAMSEYAFRDFSVSISIVARVKVFFLAQIGQLLHLKPNLDEADPHVDLLPHTVEEQSVSLEKARIKE